MGDSTTGGIRIKGVFNFAGVSSEVFGSYVFDVDIDSAPVTVYNSQSVPGKNGDILLSTKRRANISHTYSCVITGHNAAQNYEDMRNFLLSLDGYNRLEDTFHPGEYYLAYYRDAINPVVAQSRDMVGFEIQFSRKPQRFLKSGENTLVFEENGTILNPTLLDAQPLIRIYGYGTLTIGHQSVIIANQADPYIDVDCEMMDSFYGTNPKNSYVQFSDIDYPVLPAGESGITLDGNITKVEITPRWWKL